jgi:hypothetical protein
LSAHGLDGQYAAEILTCEAVFDIVVIDGWDRMSCARHAVQRLQPDGVIVWDNTDRERYAEGVQLLAAQGFRQLDFAGLGPGQTRETCTSIFYRSGNCFGI